MAIDAQDQFRRIARFSYIAKNRVRSSVTEYPILSRLGNGPRLAGSGGWSSLEQKSANRRGETNVYSIITCTQTGPTHT